LSADEIREHRGTLTERGKDSPYRNRSIEENLALFEKMRNGEFEDGTHILRAKIDMASGNINMRDPAIFRIRKFNHHRTGDKWCIYPMYDFAHCLSDSIEGITHSICTLEFEDHRPLYDWILDELKVKCHPQQIEFARLNLTYTVLSKRYLNKLVTEGFVNGWDDPRMPTIAGLRRRGFTADAIRAFCDRIGVGKTDSVVDIALLEYFVRQDLNKNAMRVMVVLNPLKVVIDNYPDSSEELDAINNPENESAGTRKVPFSKVIYIEADDFMENPPKKFFRLSPGREVRLRYAYFIKCESVVKNDKGEITEVHCTYDPSTRGGNAPDGRNVKATIHWVSEKQAINAEIRLYDRLFKTETPGSETGNFIDDINQDSLKTIKNAKLEPSLKNAKPKEMYQFERIGYFCVDYDSKETGLIFNKTVGLKDQWEKAKKAGQ